MTHALTESLATRFASVALGHVTREWPNKLDHVLSGPEDVQGPRALHLKGCVAIFCEGETWSKVK